MPSISSDDIEKVRAATDIVSLFSEVVPVTQKGSSYWCVCPFHNDKNPSLKIDPARQSFHCFGCNASGDVFKFVQLTDNVNFPDAVRKLADRAHIELHESGKPSVPSSHLARLKAVCDATAKFYHTQLMRLRTSDVDAARAYLSGRSLGGQIPNSWNLGFAPGRGALVRHLTSLGFSGMEMVDADVAILGDDGKLKDRFYNRIMFPIYDLKGDCIAFGGRIVGKGEPKYLNSKETPIFKKNKELFGLNKARDAIVASGVAIVMEGYTDVIAAHEAGVKNAVATLGTALGINHIRLLSRFAKHRIVYLFDGDEAGQKAIERALQFIDFSMTPEAGRTQVELYAVTLPDNMDPAEYLAAYSAQDFNAVIDEAVPLLEFGIERKLSRYDLTRAEGRSAALAAALQVLAPIKDSILAKDYACQLAGRLRIREEVALEQLRSVQPKPTYGEAQPESRFTQVDVSSTGEVVAKQQSAVLGLEERLPDYDDSRLSFERELLSVVACNPQQSANFAQLLDGIEWRVAVHKALASYLAESVAANLGISCAALVSEAERVTPLASAILLGGRMGAASNIGEVLTYLYEELSIGDLEESIARNKSRLASLKRAGKGESTEANDLFRDISSAQKTLLELKKSHQPLVL